MEAKNKLQAQLGSHPGPSEQHTMDSQVFVDPCIHAMSHFLLVSVLGVFHLLLISVILSY